MPKISKGNACNGQHARDRLSSRSFCRQLADGNHRMCPGVGPGPSRRVSPSSPYFIELLETRVFRTGLATTVLPEAGMFFGIEHKMGLHPRFIKSTTVQIPSGHAIGADTDQIIDLANVKSTILAAKSAV